MGVMACNRSGCENIMCDRYSSDHGYICYECYEELSKILPTDIEEFMNAPKKRYKKNPQSEEELDEVFTRCSH